MGERRCSCWTSRYEGMGHESACDAIIALDQDGLEAMWLLARDEPLATATERDAFALAAPLFDICLLPSGHDGPHEYTATDDITVSFSEVKA